MCDVVLALMEGGAGDISWMFGIAIWLSIVAIGLAALAIARPYRKCPKNKALVVVSPFKPRLCIDGGSFVWRNLEDYYYLDLESFEVEFPIRFEPSRPRHLPELTLEFTLQIGETPEEVFQAAMYLVGLTQDEITYQAVERISKHVAIIPALRMIEEMKAGDHDRIKSLHRAISADLEGIGLIVKTIGFEKAIVLSQQVSIE